VVEPGGGGELHEIAVNKPLRYRGFYVTQVNWALREARVRLKTAGRSVDLAFPLARVESDQEGAPIWGVPEEGAVAMLPSGRAALVAGDLELRGPDEPAMRFILVSGLPQAAPTGGRRGQGQRPPHAITDLGVLRRGETRSTAVGALTFVGVTKASGLGIRRDPGLPLVWAGFIACLLGMGLSFYFPFSQVYVAVRQLAGPAAGSELRLQVRGGALTESARTREQLLAGVVGSGEDDGQKERS